MAPKSWAGGYKRAFETVMESGRAASGPDSESSQHVAPSQDSSSSSHAAKLRKTLATFFLSNKLSAVETKELASAATEAGAAGSADLGKSTDETNIHRDMLRSFLKDSTWPLEYWAPVEVLDPETNQLQTIDFPFLLPHEVLHHLHNSCKDSLLSYTADPNSPLGGVVRDSCSRTGLDPTTVLPVGLHGDGAPFAAKVKIHLNSSFGISAVSQHPQGSCSLQFPRNLWGLKPWIKFWMYFLGR